MNTNTSGVSGSEKIEASDLSSREIRPIINWNEWLERWQAAATLEEMLGLLHVGFDVSLGTTPYEKRCDPNDRVIFYFKIADGWREISFKETIGEKAQKIYWFGRDSRGNLEQKSRAEIRKLVSIKAFEILCKNFFKHYAEEKLERERRQSFTLLLLSPKFQTLQNFFKVEKNGYTFVRNLSLDCTASHNNALAVEFLTELAKFIFIWKTPWGHWRPSEKEKRENENLMKIIADAKLWMIDILFAIKRADLLDGFIFQLDDACAAKLTEIAMRRELSRYDYPVSKDRPVTTLDEACYCGSKAGWLLKKHELFFKEDARLASILQAEQEKQEVEQKLADLLKNK